MELDELYERFQNRRPTLQRAAGEYAVLVPLVERPDGLHLLYEVRASTLHHQPGEVCFPGGRMEPGEDPVACALRETREELGVDPASIRVLGPLDFLLRGQGVVYPVLAHLQVADERALRLNAPEVDEVFTVPLAWLRHNPPRTYRRLYRPQVDDFPYADVGISPDYPWARPEDSVPVYYGLPHPLWGLTARITSWLVAQLFPEDNEL